MRPTYSSGAKGSVCINNTNQELSCQNLTTVIFMLKDKISEYIIQNRITGTGDDSCLFD